MKHTDDGLGKIVRMVLIAIGLFFAIVALAITCSRPAQAGHTKEPEVSMAPDGRVNIDATHTRGDGCGLFTDDPEAAGIFYDYVTDKITSPEFVIKMRDALMARGNDPVASLEFAKEGAIRCTTGKDS
jgi:hypothetical protein